MLFAKDVLVAQSRRRDHLRREEHAPARAVDRAPRRQAAHLEDRPFAHQGEAEGNRRAARRRDVAATPSSRSAGTASTTRSTRGARLLEVLSKEQDANRGAEERCPTPLPRRRSTGSWREGEPHRWSQKLQKTTQAFPGAERVLTIDGVRVEYADGFGLVRASNTTPGDRDPLRGRQRRRARAHQARFPRRAAAAQARCASSLLASFSVTS